MALAGQAMSLDGGFALASNTSSAEVETVISPMQDGGGSSEAMHVPGAGRGTDAVDTHAQNDNAPARAHAAHAQGSWQGCVAVAAAGLDEVIVAASPPSATRQRRETRSAATRSQPAAAISLQRSIHLSR